MIGKKLQTRLSFSSKNGILTEISDNIDETDLGRQDALIKHFKIIV